LAVVGDNILKAKTKSGKVLHDINCSLPCWDAPYRSYKNII
jgi:hypothetical protein